MTNTYAKLGPLWAIRCPAQQEPGSTVTVTTRAGAQKQVTLGALMTQVRGDFLYEIAERPAAAPQAIGDLTRINALFDAATANRTGRRLPAIVFTDYRINVAGDRAREPGSLTITSSSERDQYGRRKWLGRITKAGTFEPARDTDPALGDKLRAFAADPAAVAAQHGQITKSCCFCNKNLTHPASRTVGYGPDCAENFGLPWGQIADGEREMQAMEVEADRAGTIRDERAKHAARAIMETPAFARWDRRNRAAQAHAAREYNHEENDPLDHDYSMNG
jgi:hypothetical protein